MNSILIVEDEKSSREAWAAYFRAVGWTAYTASSGEEGLAVLADHAGQIDAMLLDRKMDGMSGGDVLRQMYAQGILDDICVIVVTAFSDMEGELETLGLGAWQYIAKPIVDVSKLAAVLAPGVAFNRCRRMQRTLLGLRSLEDVLAEIRSTIAAALKPDACEVLSLSDQYVTAFTSPVRAEHRAFVALLQQGAKPYVHEATLADTQALNPMLGSEARSLMAVPVFGEPFSTGTSAATGVREVVAVLAIESRKAAAFSPRWLQVLRYCADLLGMFESVRKARLAHDFMLMRELRHRLATSVHVMTDAVSAARSAAGESIGNDSPIAVLERHVATVSAVLQEAKAITDGPKIGELRATSADRVIDDVVRDGQAMCQALHVSFRRTGERGLRFHADPAAISYCLSCIVRNALEALQDRWLQDPQPFEPIVTVSSTQRDGMVCLSVADTGVGFSAQVHERLFNPLFSTKSGGRNEGIGLYSVSRIIDKMGGRIDAASAGVLRGAIFEVMLHAVSQP